MARSQDTIQGRFTTKTASTVSAPAANTPMAEDESGDVLGVHVHVASPAAGADVRWR